MMKYSRLLAALCLISLPFSVSAQTVLKQAKQQQVEQQQHNQQRESGFARTAQTRQAERDKLLSQRDQLKKQSDLLSQTFSANEGALTTLEQQLHIDTGSLGELFGVVRQTAKSLKAELNVSVTGVDVTEYDAVVNTIAAATKLPSMSELKGLWKGMEAHIVASGQIIDVSAPYITGEGELTRVAAIRLGAMGLVAEQGYLNWNGERRVATSYRQQPDDGPTLSRLKQRLEIGSDTIVIDPSRGVMLAQVANAPTLADRLTAGGVVGKVIVALLIIGIAIAVFRGGKLVIMKKQIKVQLKNPDLAGNNPLGRILSVYAKEQNRSVEALELRLLETIVDEQQGLEKGLSMLKLFAALAPMLGLLGTVTGMIETFQVITEFGNGDPKVMAGGISMALVTTVLGLVAAMPLLLAHNLLSSQAENIRLILEKQSISLVAEQAEKADAQRPVTSASFTSLTGQPA